MTAAPGKPAPKPWPMKWIVLAIVVFAVGYTAVNFYFRKPGQAYRPYQDAQDRATTARLLAAGWSKLPVHDRRPIEKPAPTDTPAAITRGAVGLGLDLDPNFAEKPKLPASIDRVTAPAAVNRGWDYTLYFTTTLGTSKMQIGTLALFHRGQDLVLVPALEALPGKDLMNRWQDSDYAATFSTESLPPGRYTVRIVANGPCSTWSFTVK
ncbi:hypothetical protein Verru16b_02886 [Lacunisphaera limnophila]|uniref:Uncharacterized protein n=1 Tax=Lacunisphaera limnophila TaxID=1838286 RepID=A0A1D8AY36_9BACT|nr:hypothetical protein [Lacunisphaera limnophila]AOS45798.1 hypothetical protein Verru16b_02886 [Lacunisphaera limnophila]